MRIKNDRYLRAVRKQTVDRTPVWIMRQAGRYLPEYRATRQKAGSFMQLCKNKHLACEVTMQPLQRFNLDAAILFSMHKNDQNQWLAYSTSYGREFQNFVQELSGL